MNTLPSPPIAGICLQSDPDMASLSLWTGNDEIIIALRPQDIEALANGFAMAQQGQRAAVYVSGSDALVVSMNLGDRLAGHRLYQERNGNE